MEQRAVPFFSVIVPVYNNETYLERCISSILTQSCTDFELILVDDGSTDHSSEICDQFAHQDNRIQIIHRKKNGGAAAARNEGLTHSSGKYVYYVDGDDWIAKKLLERAKRELNKEAAPDMYVFCYVRIKEKGKYEKRRLKVEAGLYDKNRLEKEIYPGMIRKLGRTIQGGIVPGTLCDMIIRKQLLEKYYCKNMSLFRGEDSVCAWECIYHADAVFFSNEGMYFYNCMNASSCTKIYNPRLYENNKTVAEYLRVHLHADKNHQIERQINALEFRGMIDTLHQELYFRQSINKSAKFLKKKCKKEKVVCRRNGLPFSVYPYIFLLNHHCFAFLMICIWIKPIFIDIFRRFDQLVG